MKNSPSSQTQLDFPAFDPRQNCGTVCSTKSWAAQSMGRRSTLGVSGPLSLAHPTSAWQEKGGFAIHPPSPPPRSRLSGRSARTKALPGWAIRVGRVGCWERPGKTPWASCLHPDATHTTLSKHTHKNTLWLGLQTPSGPESQPGVTTDPIMCPSVLPLFPRFSCFA